MRFVRHAKIFRGPLDMAPVAGVSLLLMMFMLLGSLVYTPGVLVDLSQILTVTRTNTFVFAGNTYAAGDFDRLRANLNSSPGNAGFSVAVEPGADPASGRQASNLLQITPITVTRTNAIVFAGNTYSAGELDRLRTDLKSSAGNARFSVAVESGADPALSRQASNLFQIDLPEGRNLTGTENATVVVAVNFRGQCFCENRLVQDADLRKELAGRLRLAARDSKKLTMILLVDKAAEYQVLTRLCGLATEAGVTQVLMGERRARVWRAPMKRAIQSGSSWSRERLLAVAGVLFALQAGLIFLFGDHPGPQPPRSGPAVRFQAFSAPVSEDQLLQQFFVGDPAVFPLPNSHGFSGRGWLNQQPLTYQPESQLEPPSLLNLDSTRLGSNFPGLPSNPPPLAPALIGQQSPHREPWPVFLPPETLPTQSVFRLEGGLSDRLLGAAPVLRVWTNAQPLRKTIVQIAVNPAGEVVAARLEERCDLDEADADALAKARKLRFSSRAAKGTQWGAAVFQWQTAAPAAASPLK